MHIFMGYCAMGMLALDHSLMNPTSKNYCQAAFREFMAAIGVMALILLSFAHQPIGRDDSQVFRFADGSIPVFCGSAPVQDNSFDQGKGCEACRLSAGAVLPNTPCTGSQTFAVLANSVFTVLDSPTLRRFVSGNANPRAPPIHLNN